MTSGEELKQKLIEQMRSRDNKEALRAAEELRERGWLKDGSLEEAILSWANLRRAYLHGADLRDADLSDAVLINANLGRAILNNANLSRAFLSDADLRQANLLEVRLGRGDLRGANLSESRLIRANLRDANLHGANLTGTHLIETDFIGANMQGVLLRGATLSGVDLSGADLLGADLQDAVVSDAIFTEAICGHTVFANVDLSIVKGLETARHQYPSTVGIDTLYKSKGHIPDVFLRGCGVPENLITYHRSLIGQAIDFFPAFISYSHKDRACAQRIHDTLQGQGIRCWLDIHQIKPGHHIWDEIERGIRHWDKTILCCSEHSLTSDWVENELENLFAKERRIRERLRKQQGTDPGPVRLLIPLDLDGFVFSEEFKSGMKQHIISRHVADFTNWKQDSDKFDEKMKEVVAFLRPDEGREPPPPSLIAR